MDLAVVAMCSAGILVFLIGVLASRNDIAGADGLDKIVAVANLCFAPPLAVFGALHLFGSRFVADIVPDYMPMRMFWVYSVGCALIAASLSIASTTLVRWSGLLLGIMMFLFVAMIHLPGALNEPYDRFIWTIVLRETSFGGAGLLFAASAAHGWSGWPRKTLLVTGRLCIAAALLLFGVEHILHATGLPGVPLRREMPVWIPYRELVDYLTGAMLLACGGSILFRWRTRMVAACVGGWIVLMVLVIYGPVLVAALSGPDTATQLEGINYFADTLLFGGAILGLARATPRSVAPAP